MAAMGTAPAQAIAITIPPAGNDHGAVNKPSQRANQGLHQVAGGLMFALGLSWCISTEYLVLRKPEVRRAVSLESIDRSIDRSIHWHRMTRSIDRLINLHWHRRGPSNQLNLSPATRHQVLPYVYVAQIVPLLLYRFITYYRMGWSHFTIELCYLSNALLILNVV